MDRTERNEQSESRTTATRRPYTAPALRVFGNAATLTQVQSMIGLADGAGNNGAMSRTG